MLGATSGEAPVASRLATGIFTGFREGTAL
jgi:hypothetical protein